MGFPDPVPVPSLPAIGDPTAVSARLVPVPAGCAAPAQEQAVFVGTMVVNDAATARFAVEQVWSGSIVGYTKGGLVDVRFGDEVRFLDVDQQYIVGAGTDAGTPGLVSSVRSPAPLFGGNEVAGLDNSDVDCPRIENPARTLLADGTSVESGVLTPMKDARTEVVRAIAEPVAVAFAVLLGLVVVKHLVFALGRSLRDLGNPEPAPAPAPSRSRRHQT
ncbi:MAG: hypothetical protein WEB78_12360 [Ilumatobacteraceae bacterium]